MEKIVIVGGVAAGATAAAKTRRLAPDAEITMLEAGKDISFANCGLPYYIGGDIKSRSKLILQSPESFKSQYNVDVFTNTQVISIDREQRLVKTKNTADGSDKTFEYTKLILAQGGKPVKPNIPGADGDHVFTLWTLQDMDKITDFIERRQPKTATVVGGGFIGLEMAEALTKRGLQVNVIEMMPHVMNVMDAETAGFIEHEMYAYGVNLLTSRSVMEILPHQVKLDNDTLLDSDIVLLSIGVRPTLQLAADAGLETGEVGGLLVDEFLQTSDPNIYGAGDMVEITHKVNGKKVRIPLAGPANRQGRIAAENALGGHHPYNGAIGTSIVRVFEAVAGITGLSLKQALAAGIDAEAVAVHKEHHTSYYPGAETVSVFVVYDKNTGVIVGGQTCGYKGADRRLDVLATAVANKLTVHDLAETDFAYSPPLGTPNDAINMAAYVAENRMSGYSPSVTAAELDEFVKDKKVVFVDVRDIFAYQKSHIMGAIHIPLEALPYSMDRLPKDAVILVYCDKGKTSHQALRMLKGAGFNDVVNISGGHVSLQRYQIAFGFNNLQLDLLLIEKKSLEEKQEETANVYTTIENDKDMNSPIIIDVRTPEEFATGAYPGAINVPLDVLDRKVEEVIGKDMNRDITLYCASGARSSYAQQYLMQLGFKDVKNGGGLMQMMMRQSMRGF